MCFNDHFDYNMENKVLKNGDLRRKVGKRRLDGIFDKTWIRVVKVYIRETDRSKRFPTELRILGDSGH